MASANTATVLPAPRGYARVLACALCQHRKVKCDRNGPCSNCVKVCHLHFDANLRHDQITGRPAPAFAAWHQKHDPLTFRVFRPVFPVHRVFQRRCANADARIKTFDSALPAARSYFCNVLAMVKCQQRSRQRVKSSRRASHAMNLGRNPRFSDERAMASLRRPGQPAWSSRTKAAPASWTATSGPAYLRK
jgi:hypothetical protein